MVALHLYLLDGIDGLFWKVSFEEESDYAKGYSDSSFKKVKLNMDKQQVIDLISKPLYKGWEYIPKSNCDLAIIWVTDDLVSDFSFLDDRA